MKKIAIFLNTFTDAVILLVYKIKKIKEKYLLLFKKQKSLFVLIPLIIFLIYYLLSSIYELYTTKSTFIIKVLLWAMIPVLVFSILAYLKIVLELSFSSVFKSNKSKFRDEIDEIQNAEKSTDIDEIKVEKKEELISLKDSSIESQMSSELQKQEFYNFFPKDIFNLKIEKLLIENGVIEINGKWIKGGFLPKKNQIYVLLTKFHLLGLVNLNKRGNKKKIIVLSQVYFDEILDESDFGKIFNNSTDSSIDKSHDPFKSVFAKLVFLNTIEIENL
ncbi:hypothetical protein [Polaribacter atrinae]|uniref:Uncharacterized protein n=1 Tax=Polaribacter atrinae TaxID=1333662 RepID=A0A176T692_9FLAO|nr:hypothetical protein [Polaribacter atrinae]OAD42946.1 hypothetical protein LPB303_13800 [Polaribacter atrinae]